MTRSQQVLSLYRQLLRKGKQLKFTDKDYYFKRMRVEFEKNRALSDKSEIEHNIQVNDNVYTIFNLISTQHI